jgi:hypothetical protein
VGLAATVRLGVDRTSGPDVRPDVRDRVAQPVAAGPPLEVHRLVQVLGAGRVDRQEGQVGQVLRRQPRLAGRLLRLGQDVGREVGRQVQLVADPREPRAQRPPPCLVANAQGEVSAWHGRHPKGGRLRTVW